MTQKAIDITEFNLLEEEYRLNLLHKNGVHVGKRQLGGQTFILFQLNDFYVEVFYRIYRKEIDSIVTSKSPDILQPYLDQINIKGIDNGNDNT